MLPERGEQVALTIGAAGDLVDDLGRHVPRRGLVDRTVVVAHTGVEASP
ncbi:hypothetical protein [Streptomyces halstedii]|uniref:Uncharacterized protein n=1 Tax=Streptomyces halstedii TaxID=1944 RepID=A0A6N9U9J2_STRHA|nr:hypothetical protein [Streptomyces halstedii]NEA20187.1 hypothetical protein [Streptomyces halstedii]